MQHLPLLSLLVLLPYTTAWPKELVTKVPVEEEPTSLLHQVQGRELVGEARELPVASTPGAYRETVPTIIGQMERAARSADTLVQIILHLL